METGTPGPAQRKRRVTIEDVAGHLRLTKSTVSRALNGYPDIAEGTRLRVRKAADAMGYRPLSHAQAIRTGRVRTVGLVLQVNQHNGHRPFLAEFLAGVSQAATAEDWTMTLSMASSDADTLRLMQQLVYENKADGFIVPRTYLDDPRIDFLRDAQVPFVLYGRTRNPQGCAWYDISGEDAMRDAVITLHGLGHRRIGFLRGGRGYTYADLRLQGYQAGLAHCGLPQDAALLSGPAVTQDEGAAAAQALLAGRNPPTAMVCAVDLAALGVYRAAEDLGLQMGHDLSVISYDGIPEGALVRPGLSTFAVDSRAAGSRLTQILIKLIRGDAPEQHREISQARFLERGSHGTAALTSDALAAHVRAKSEAMGGPQ